MFLSALTYIGSGEGRVGAEVWYFSVIMEQVDEDRPGEECRGQAVEGGADQSEEHFLENNVEGCDL